MARNSRQNKLLEIISSREIETQEELVVALKNAKFDVTQATISRDIKELGLIKVQTEDKKYKYAVPNAPVMSNQDVLIAKTLIQSMTCALNQIVLKVTKGTASFVASIIEQCNIIEVLGTAFGEDTVLIITSSVEDALLVKTKLEEVF